MKSTLIPGKYFTASFRLLVTAMFISLLALPLFADEVRPKRATGDFQDAEYAIDGRSQTRATTGTPDYRGRSILLDLAYETLIEGVIQDHGASADDYPMEYRVEISREARPYQTVWQGRGSRGESIARFTPTMGRFIRITATREHDTFHWWSIYEVRVIVRETARTDWTSGRIWGDMQDPQNAIDGNEQTRATTGTPNYAGRSITLDLGGEYEISRVTQIHSPSDDDYPASYEVSISRDKSRWREVYRGSGSPGRSSADFEERDVRYIRITALERRNNFNWWSIHELVVRKGRASGIGGIDEDRRRVRQVVDVRSNGFQDARRAADGSLDTRANTGSPRYAGSWISFDLGGDYEISRVAQNHGSTPEEFPGRYIVEVSRNGTRWTEVHRGHGERQRSVAEFQPVRCRYVRITALEPRNNSTRWSISEIRIRE